MKGTIIIREFLESVTPQTGIVTIWRRGTYGPKAPINIAKWYDASADFEAMVEDAERFNNFDVYTSPASYKAESREMEYVDKVATAWLDGDTCEPENLRIEPSIIVESSPGRWQMWWILDQEHDAHEVANIVKKISYAHRHQGADISSHAANKLMRVPGSVNSNHGFPSTVKAAYTGNVYSLEELAEAYADIDVTPPSRKGVPTSSQVKQPEDLPDYMTVLAKLPKTLLDFAIKQPKDGETPHHEVRYRFLCDLFRLATLEYDEVLSVAWGAPVNKKWNQDDERGIDGLLYEAGKAFTEVEWEREKLENTPRPEGTTAVARREISLLSESERKVAHEVVTFVDEYIEWSKSKTSVQNPPYDYMNAWTALALMYGEKYYIPFANGDRYLNIYSFTLGQTTSGKTEAKHRLFKLLGSYFKDDPDYNLGGNMSPEALAARLLDRDDKVSFINKDEVHGWLKTLADPKGGYQTGLVEDFAELYDGYLPPVLRKSLKGESGKSAHVIVTMHLMGTPEEIIKVLTRDMFKSGFLARFIWAVGNPRNVTKKSLKTKLRSGARAIEDMDERVEQWIRDANTWSGRPIPVDISDVTDRLDDAAWDLVRLVPESDPNYDILNPSLTRLGMTIKKCAALLAVADGRTVVEMQDVCYVLEQAETWAENLISIAAQISASEFERKQDEIEAWISARADKRATKTTVTNRFGKGDYREFKLVMEALENRGIVLTRAINATDYYYVNENGGD